METEYRDIPIDEIFLSLEEQQKLDADVIRKLKTSIEAYTLIHPITVVPSLDITTPYKVKAGKKRFVALVEMGHKTVKCLVIPPNTPEDMIEDMSIEENLHRLHMPWWAQCELELTLHKNRQAKHGAGKKGPGNKGWSLRDTAAELEIGLGTLSQDLRLAEAVMADPTLRKIEDKATAVRLMLNTAKRINAEVEASLPNTEKFNYVLHGDASEILKHYEDNTFDVCFTDPPWLDYKDEKLRKDDQTILVFKELYRVMKHDSFLYMIVSTPDFYIYYQELKKFGFKIQQTPLIWQKGNVLSHGLRGWEYGRDYEPILLAVKGNPVLTQRGQLGAVYSSPAIHYTKAIHPNEKPVDVPEYYLNHCSYENSLIIDPFGGSGVTAEACINLRRRYVIIERDKRFFDGIERRLTGLKQNLGDT